MINLYIETSLVLQRAFQVLESKIEKPAFVKRGTYYVFRYESQSVRAAVIQKLARVISGLNASLLLLQGGFVQEPGAIFRTLDEFNEDIVFLCQAIRTGEVTKLHQEYLESFYQEEFDEPNNPFLSEQNRQTIPRRKIQAAIANMQENDLNPSDTERLSRTISRTYSGYVHGASVHIMDMMVMYGGDPPRYLLAGMRGTSRVAEFMADAWNYFYRGILSGTAVAISFGEPEILKELFAFRGYFERQSGKTEWEDPEKMVKRMKRKKAQQPHQPDAD
jgi:hypothetical protein